MSVLLPDDVWQLVFRNLDPCLLAGVRLTCRRFAAVGLHAITDVQKWNTADLRMATRFPGLHTLVVSSDYADFDLEGPTSEQAAAFAAYLTQTPHLRVLDLAWSDVLDMGSPLPAVLAHAVSTCTQLTSLALRDPARMADVTALTRLQQLSLALGAWNRASSNAEPFDIRVLSPLMQLRKLHLNVFRRFRIRGAHMLAALPNLSSLGLTVVNPQNHSASTFDAEEQSSPGFALSSLRQLTELELHDWSFGNGLLDDGLTDDVERHAHALAAQLRVCDRLAVLSIDYDSRRIFLDHPAVAAAVARLPNLISLGGQLLTYGQGALSGLPRRSDCFLKLQSLRLCLPDEDNGSRHPSRQWCETLATWTGLTSLTLSNMANDQPCLEAVWSSLANLHQLSWQRLTPQMSTLQRLQRLEIVSLGSHGLAPHSLAQQLSVLQHLTALPGFQLWGDTMPFFMGEQLERQAGDYVAPEAALQAIGRCTGLLLLSIHGFGVVTDAGLAALSPLRRLVSLRITCAQSMSDVTEQGLAAAVTALPRLLYMDISARQLLGGGMAHIGGSCKYYFELPGVPGRSFARHPSSWPDMRVMSDEALPGEDAM